MQKKKLIVIGGGAAGFFCAVNAAGENLDVILLEKTDKVLSKVKVSGGGRCNVTNACSSIPEMARNYPRGEKFLKQSFHNFFTADTIGWFDKRGVKLKTEADGRMFPVSDSSDTIIGCLLQEANKNKVQLLMNREVERVTVDRNRQFHVELKNYEERVADFICIACGGYAKEQQYKWITNLGHSFEKPVPSLFTFNIPGNDMSQLMGISINDVTVKLNGTKFSQNGPVLITHWGLSGPAVLKLSSFAARELASLGYQFSITVNWVSEYNETSMIERLKMIRNEISSRKIINQNPFRLPQRFWEYQINCCDIHSDLRWAHLSSKQQHTLAKQLCSQPFAVNGKTTCKEEFVTAGGIKLNEIEARTMQSKIVPGLFFAGEIMDVDGITGGYNFQHAWTSGFLAASAIRQLAGIKELS
ncbi:MAG TPA: NAD(P)/FAD-dependent oxidoreductase [Chitinophagaceae bacterium]|nr:NAD(P)/FAD-dependent oxidoreductase [Chitinophagaceae bacterium]